MLEHRPCQSPNQPEIWWVSAKIIVTLRGGSHKAALTSKMRSTWPTCRQQWEEGACLQRRGQRKVPTP